MLPATGTSRFAPETGISVSVVAVQLSSAHVYLERHWPSADTCSLLAGAIGCRSISVAPGNCTVTSSDAVSYVSRPLSPVSVTEALGPDDSAAVGVDASVALPSLPSSCSWPLWDASAGPQTAAISSRLIAASAT